MSLISEVVAAIEAASEKVVEGFNEVSAARQTTTDALTAAEDLGSGAAIDGLEGVSTRLEDILTTLNGAVEAIGETIAQAQAITGDS